MIIMISRDVLFFEKKRETGKQTGIRKLMSSVKHFEEGAAPEYNKDLVTEIRKRHPHVFMVCFRDKNRNVVVYEARVENGKFLDPPVDAYWLILEPSYQEPRRKQGILHDREELGFLDHKFAWGFESKRLSDTDAQFSFKAFKHNMTVKISDNRKESYLLASKDGKNYLLKQMYVRASDNLKLLNPSDNVKSILLKGLDITKKPYSSAEVYLKGGPE